MSLTLYHRTTIAEARRIVERGFEDADWDFGVRDARTGEDMPVTGVWLADRPLGENDGIAGDAVVEVILEAEEQDLAPYELEGMLWNARLWVPPADFVRSRAKLRIAEVDPRSSWFHRAVNEDTEAG